PGIHNRAALFADDLVVPLPSSWIDGLPYRAQQPQARHIVRGGPLVAVFDETADGRGRSVEDVDPILLDHPPEAVGVRKIRRALVHHGSGPRRERTVHDVAMARDPADIGG